MTSVKSYLSASWAKLSVIAGGVSMLLSLAYVWRPMWFVRGPFMLAYRHPALITIPLIGGLLGLAAATIVHALRGRMSKTRQRSVPSHVWNQPDTSESYEVPLLKRMSAPLWWALGVSLVAFVWAISLTDAYTQAAIADHTRYQTLDIAQLKGGDARLTPKEVAQQQIGTFNSSTEQTSNLHATLVDGKFTWTAARDPKGTINVYRKPTRGVIAVDGDASEPQLTVHGKPMDAAFKYGPGMKVSESIRWQIAKKFCWTCDIQEIVALPTPDGPVFMASFVTYKGGWLVKRPVFGGVFLIHPDGQIERLTPEQAKRNALVAGSGRMFPEALARRIADAYKYRKGVGNRVFTHEDGFEVQDTTGNSQPYMQDFQGSGPQWTTTMSPRGKSTTGMVMFTDTTDGSTRVWRAPESESLIGNQKATDAVRATTLGLVFAGDGAVDAAGKFRAVEPRQVFVAGKLMFMVSVIPDSAAKVSRTAIVDPHMPGRVTHVFPASPDGDKALIAFLNTGTAAAQYVCHGSDCPATFTNADEPTTGTPDSGDRVGQPGSGSTLPAGTDATSTIQRLLAQNRDDQQATRGRLADLKAQERDLTRLLAAAGKTK